MELRLTEQEALTLYRIILRWDELGSLTTEDDEERQLLWDLSCTLEKELEPVDDAVRAAGAVVEYSVGERLRFFKYNSHQSFPPSFALRIASSTSSGDGIMPPTRKQRSTGFLHSTASCTSSRIWPMLSSTQTNRFT